MYNNMSVERIEPMTFLVISSDGDNIHSRKRY